MKVYAVLASFVLVIPLLSSCASECDKARERLDGAQANAYQWMQSDQFKKEAYESERAAIEARYSKELISYEEYQQQLRDLGDFPETPAQYSLRVAQELVDEKCGN